jgi:hypothetical protein
MIGLLLAVVLVFCWFLKARECGLLGICGWLLMKACKFCSCAGV